MKTILPVITLALATSVAFAADFDDALNYETITLKSGDKVSGYIVSQNNSEFFTFKPVEQYVEADTCIADTAVVEVVPLDMTVADSTVVGVRQRGRGRRRACRFLIGRFSGSCRGG